MDKGFPVDIYAIKEYGVEKWLEEFSWPVSEWEYVELYRDIDALWQRLRSGCSEEEATLIDICQKLRIEYANFLHALIVSERVEADGREVLCSERSWWYKDFKNGGEVTAYIPRVCTPPPAKNGPSERFICGLKGLALSLIHNRKALKLFKAFKNGSITRLYYGSITPLMKNYIGTLDEWVHVTYRRNLYDAGRTAPAPDGMRENLRRLSEDMARGLSSIAEKAGPCLSGEHMDHLKGMTENEFLKAAQLYNGVSNSLGRQAGRMHLILANTANDFERTLSFIVRKGGGKTTTFIHGGDVGFRNVSISLDICTADEFVAYNKKSADFFEKIKDDPEKCRSGTKVIAGESDEYLKLWKRYRRTAVPEGIERVMVMGYPQDQWRRIMYIAGFSLTRLDLELRLVKLLKEKGYEVIYKAHPERKDEIDGIFDPYARVSKEYFQDVMDGVDAFLFPTSTTTTFPLALCTKKPIITLDLSFKLYEPFADAMELYKKRCRLVMTEFDKRNRVIFDEDALLEALSKRVEEPNDEFLKTYYFPDNKKWDTPHNSLCGKEL